MNLAQVSVLGEFCDTREFFRDEDYAYEITEKLIDEVVSLREKVEKLSKPVTITRIDLGQATTEEATQIINREIERLKETRSYVLTEIPLSESVFAEILGDAK